MRTDRVTGWHKWKLCLGVSHCTLLLILYCCRHVKGDRYRIISSDSLVTESAVICHMFYTGVVEISPSAVAPVCQVGDQLELTCNSTGMIHRWEVTVMIPQIMTTTINVLASSSDSSGQSPVVTINNSTFTAPRLSAPGSLPLVSGMTVTPVSRSLQGTVVSCFEGTTSTESLATTTIKTIDPGQFGKKLCNLVSVKVEGGRCM